MFGDRRYFRELLAGSEEGVASNILADRLRRLVNAGLLTREDAGPGRRAGQLLAVPGVVLAVGGRVAGGVGGLDAPEVHPHAVVGRVVRDGDGVLPVVARQVVVLGPGGHRVEGLQVEEPEPVLHRLLRRRPEGLAGEVAGDRVVAVVEVDRDRRFQLGLLVLLDPDGHGLLVGRVVRRPGGEPQRVLLVGARAPLGVDRRLEGLLLGGVGERQAPGRAGGGEPAGQVHHQPGGALGLEVDSDRERHVLRGAPRAPPCHLKETKGIGFPSGGQI